MFFDSTTILVVCIIFIATYVRSAFGFGDALIAMPILAVIFGLKTATPLVALTASTTALVILTGNWRRVRLRSAWRLIVSTLAGIPVGLLFLKESNEGMMKVILAVLLVVFALYRLVQPALWTLMTDKSAFLFGFIAGILGGAYNTNGPPVVVYGSLRRWPPQTFRATLQGYFFPTGLLIVVGHGTAGLWTRVVFQYYILVLPAVLLAIWAGGRLHRILPEGRFDRCIHVLLLLVGLYLLLQTLGGIL